MPRLTWRWLLALVGAALLLALLLPLVLNINRFQRQVRRTLEAEFSRRVSLGRMTLRLVPSLGLDAEYVTVDEDPAFGAEPFIRAEKLACDVNPWKLWSGRVEFSRLVLTNPSINLVKNADGRWNVAAFLEEAGRKSQTAPSPRLSFSALVLDGARFNVKVRDEKKVYGLVDTDARLERAANARWRLELEGTAFRSDRALTEAGTLRLRGELGPIRGAYGELPFALNLSVEKAQLADLLVLFLGREYGVLGRVRGEARLAGTPRQFRAEGTAQVGDIHRWDLLAPPRTPIWQLRYRVAVHTASGVVQLEELAAETAASRFRATGNFQPWASPQKWEIRFAPLELAVPDLWAIYAGSRKAVDQTAEASGAASGALIWKGPANELEGSLDWQGVALETRSLPVAVEAERFRIDFFRDRANLKALSLVFRSRRRAVGVREAVDVSATWLRARQPSTLHLQLTSRNLRLDHLTPAARAVALDFAGGSELSGLVSFALDFRGPLVPGGRLARQGWVELRDVELRSPWLNRSIGITAARLDFSGSHLRIAALKAVIAGANVSGSLALATGRSLDCEFNLEADRLDTEQLDLFLNPRRRSQAARAAPENGAPAGTADFFTELRGRGQISVSRFGLGWLGVENLRTQVNYNARHMRLEKLSFEVLGGRFSGEAQLDLVNPPGYRLAGQLDRAQLELMFPPATQAAARYAGLLSARGQLESTGSDKAQLIENLTGRGAFIIEEARITRFNLQTALSRAAGLAVDAASAPETEVHSLSGEFFLAEKSVRLKGAVLTVPGASATLEGIADLEGRLNLSLSAQPLPPAGTTTPPVWPAEIFEHRYRVVGSLAKPDARAAEPTRAPR